MWLASQNQGQSFMDCDNWMCDFSLEMTTNIIVVVKLNLDSQYSVHSIALWSYASLFLICS